MLGLLLLLFLSSRLDASPPPSRSSAASAAQAIERSCQPIDVPMCQGLMYNTTGMPNFIGHETQQEAQLSIQTYSPLVTYGCSRKLKFFLCSVHTPMCSPMWKHPIGPCRPLCEHVRERCLPVLREFGFEWPHTLNCSKFPARNIEQHMCMDGPTIEETSAPGPAGTGYQEGRPGSRGPILRQRTVAPGAVGECGELRNAEKYVYVNRTQSCALKCSQHDLFSAEDKHIAEVWMGVLSGLCFVSTLFTVLTFLIDARRFKYPERPIVFLAMCYNIYSISYFVRLIGGREAIACDVVATAAGQQSILIQKGLDNTDCAIAFVLHYYFYMASATWWVILTFSWLLAAGLKWGHEAIQRHSCWYHFIAWLLPALLTVVVLVMRDVDADELLGMCSVGNQKENTLLAFLIIPSVLQLILGSLFLFGGFMALMKIRRHVKNGGIKTDRLEILMVRIGVFSVLYVVPATCVLACQLYELSNRARWHARPGPRAAPSVEVFMLRIFMCLVVGITSGVWVWSVKTIHSWRKFCRRGPAGAKMAPLGAKDGAGKAPALNASPGMLPGANGLPPALPPGPNGSLPLVGGVMAPGQSLSGSHSVVGVNGGVPIVRPHQPGSGRSSLRFENYRIGAPGQAPAQTPRMYRPEVKYTKPGVHAETVI